jgi:hypothetical protein
MMMSNDMLKVHVQDYDTNANPDSPVYNLRSVAIEVGDILQLHMLETHVSTNKHVLAYKFHIASRKEYREHKHDKTNIIYSSGLFRLYSDGLKALDHAPLMVVRPTKILREQQYTVNGAVYEMDGDRLHDGNGGERDGSKVPGVQASLQDKRITLLRMQISEPEVR